MNRQLRLLMMILVLSGMGIGFCLGVLCQMAKQDTLIQCWTSLSKEEPPEIPDNPQSEEPPEKVPDDGIVSNEIIISKPSQFSSFTSTITVTTSKPETRAYAIRQAKELAKLVKSIPSVQDIVIDRIFANIEGEQYIIYP